MLSLIVASLLINRCILLKMEKGEGIQQTSNTTTTTTTSTESTEQNTKEIQDAEKKPTTPASTEALDKEKKDADKKPDTKVSWEWCDDSGWKPYDILTSSSIEKAHSEGKLTVPLNHGYFGMVGGYTIEFATMVQRKVSTGYTRMVRRVPPLPNMPQTIYKKPISYLRKPHTRPKVEIVRADPKISMDLKCALLFLRQNAYDEGHHQPHLDVPVHEIFVNMEK